MERVIVIAKKDQMRHGKKLIKENSPYQVVGEDADHYLIEHRTGVRTHIRKTDAMLVTLNKKIK